MFSVRLAARKRKNPSHVEFWYRCARKPTETDVVNGIQTPRWLLFGLVCESFLLASPWAVCITFKSNWIHQIYTRWIHFVSMSFSSSALWLLLVQGKVRFQIQRRKCTYYHSNEKNNNVKALKQHANEEEAGQKIEITVDNTSNECVI